MLTILLFLLSLLTFLTFLLNSTPFTQVYNSQLTISMTTTSIFSTSKFTPLVLLSTENLRIQVKINTSLVFHLRHEKLLGYKLLSTTYKICSTETLLKDELQHIQNFMSWNGFPRKLSLKLLKQFKPLVQTTIDHETQVDNSHVGTNNNDPKIWIHLPYLGKYGTQLTCLFIHRITPLLNLKCNFTINWKTTNSNSFHSCKDKTPTKYHRSVVYKFTCPGCKSRYISITDLCF